MRTLVQYYKYFLLECKSMCIKASPAPTQGVSINRKCDQQKSHFQILTLSVSLGRNRAFVDHGMSYIFWKLYRFWLQRVVCKVYFPNVYFCKVCFWKLCFCKVCFCKVYLPDGFSITYASFFVTGNDSPFICYWLYLIFLVAIGCGATHKLWNWMPSSAASHGIWIGRIRDLKTRHLLMPS